MKVYFTHSSVSFFGGGWTEVDANDMRYAVSVYRMFHPDTNSGFVDCAAIYTDDEFEQSGMYKNGNFGRKCVERISIKRELV